MVVNVCYALPQAVYSTQIDHFGMKEHLKCPERNQQCSLARKQLEKFLLKFFGASDSIKPVRTPGPLRATSCFIDIDCK